MIILIDFSSYGDAVFYLDYWKKAIKSSEVDCFVICHSNNFSLSKYNLAIPLLFTNNKNKFLQFIYKFLIQYFVIIIITLLTFFKKQKIEIIFNLHQPFKFWNFLLNFSKKRKVIFDIIIHDIIEFDTSNYPKLIVSNNKSIIYKADNVILHSGFQLFKDLYGSKINTIDLPFPSRLPYEKSEPIVLSKYFYIPGRYRKEKGFDFVIKNWPKDETKILVISTKLPLILEDIVKLKNNILYMPSLNSSGEFQNLLANSYACILMYSSGTNSGVLTTIIANNVRCIVSDLSMFKTHSQSKKFIEVRFDKNDFINMLNSLDKVRKPTYSDDAKKLKDYEVFLKSRLC